MTSPVRLLIADNAATRFGIRIALGDRAQVCAEAEDAEQAILAAKRVQPDMCLIGIRIRGGGTEAVRGISRVAPHASVVVLAEDADPEDLLDAVRAGAVGYVPGDVDAERLRKIVGAVEAREAVVPRAMVLDLLAELRSVGGGADGPTGREAQVLRMLRRGHTTAEIAIRLDIAPVTVRRHISELVHKLGVEDRAALVVRDAERRPVGRR